MRGLCFHALMPEDLVLTYRRCREVLILSDAHAAVGAVLRKRDPAGTFGRKLRQNAVVSGGDIVEARRSGATLVAGKLQHAACKIWHGRGSWHIHPIANSSGLRAPAGNPKAGLDQVAHRSLVSPIGSYAEGIVGVVTNLSGRRIRGANCRSSRPNHSCKKEYPRAHPFSSRSLHRFRFHP